MKKQETKQKLNDLVREYADQFTTTLRGAENITILKDDASSELKKAVREAHGGQLRSDWIFSNFHAILDNLSGYTVESRDDIEEYRHEIVDGLVDIYNHDLTAWLGDNTQNLEWVNEAGREYGHEAGDTIKSIQLGQYMAIDDIYSHVVKLLENAYN